MLPGSTAGYHKSFGSELQTRSGDRKNTAY